MLSRFKPRNSAIMIDVGSTGIRVCQLSGHADRLAIRDHLRLDLPPGVRRDDGIGIDVARLSRACRQGRFAGGEIGLVLSPPMVQFHTLEASSHLLDKSRDSIRDALAWEIARETRTEPDDWEVRYWRFPAGHRPGRNVMTAAISSQTVRGWVSNFARHDLQLRLVTVSPCALARVAARSWSPAEHDIWGVLDIGLHHSVLTVLVAASPVYVREISYGSADWTQRLASAFDVSVGDAEEIKRRHGLRLGHAGGRATSGARDAEVDSVLANTLRPALNDLAREIKRCFMYVLESYPSLSVTRLFIGGGGAKLTGLAEHLSALLDLPTALLMGGSAEKAAPEACSAAVPLEGAAALGGSLLDVEARRCNR